MPPVCKTSTARKGRRIGGIQEIVMDGELARETTVLDGKEIEAVNEDMENHGSPGGYTSDDSVDSMYAVQVDMDVLNSGSVDQKLVPLQSSVQEVGSTSTAMNAVSANDDMASAFGAQLNQLILKAFMQTSSAWVASQVDSKCDLEKKSTSQQTLSTDAGSSEKTWSERTYNIVKAKRRRETQMTRTSAGEGSNSEKEFPIPDNESPQERSVRMRRLNRHRKKRAKDLADNRRAFKKRPYVIHVDGMAKARGIHKHTWRAALRGQCRRLDPSMDNINHHPKQVVDSIWHALEKEWEFEGFAHRAREMFERSATKLMRNRKIQLKYKSQKLVDGSKPDDVIGKFWSKIVDLKNAGVKKRADTKGDMKTEELNKDKPIADDSKKDSLVDDQMTKELATSSDLPKSVAEKEQSLSDGDDVDARISSLQRELLRLQNSRKVCFEVQDGSGSSARKVVEDIPLVQAVDKVSKCMKENVKPVDPTSGGKRDESIAKKSALNVEGDENVNDVLKGGKSSAVVLKAAEMGVQSSGHNRNGEEMDCGDIVKVFAFTSGRREEIGRTIVMGLPGTKFAKKDIPKDWHSIKFMSCTKSGGLKICPFPPGWSEQLRSKTVKEVNGRTILWPDMLLRTLEDD